MHPVIQSSSYRPPDVSWRQDRKCPRLKDLWQRCCPASALVLGWSWAQLHPNNPVLCVTQRPEGISVQRQLVHQTGEGFNGNYWQYGQFWRLVCWVSSPKKNMTRRKPESRGSTWKAKPHCSIYRSNHYAAMPDFYPTARKRRYNMRQPACIHIHLIIQYKFVEKRERER